ncbi:MAG: gliding motility protein GldM [Bacteroidales bacterium]|jgi:gliding motility-associated protein GldM|nr:gliding motility protein GldM [Bacteroidales bacterium]
MSGGKETPRQKMIGMMYLVLTAMLALNVSTAILRSFLIVNDSIESTNINFESKVASSYTMFDQALAENKDKVQSNYDKAQEAKKLAADFRAYVQNMKGQLISAVTELPVEEAKNFSPHNIARQDDYDTPSRFFIEQGHGKELREKIAAFEKDMLALLPEDVISQINLPFDIEGPFKDESGQPVSWETVNFYGAIIVASITILNKLENDAMNLEYDVVNKLYDLVSSGDMTFSNVVAKIVPKSTFVTLGEAFEAEVFLVAFDDKTRITANVNGQNLVSKDGIINYTSQPSKEGVFSVSGFINMPGGDQTSYPFKTEYIVAAPMAAVSADKMNVLYIGLDNPISTSVSGVDPSGVTATITNGTLSKVPGSGGSYIARVNNLGEATITLTVKSGNSTKTAGTFRYRVKKVPDPVAIVNGFDEFLTIVDKNNLANSGGLIPRLKDFDFELNNLKINSFSMNTIVGGDVRDFKSNSNRFTDEMVTAMRNSKKGQRFFFENIKCQMPTGPTDLRSIVLTIK